MAEPFYDWLAQNVANDECRFLNYGFIEPSRQSAPDADAVSADELHHALLARVLEGCSLEGQRVLEVGCGRGGNCFCIETCHAPGLIVGVDLCLPNLVFCKQSESRSAAFAGADAQILPFAEGSFDVVLNLESSHCYADLKTFSAEVVRVLRPGGLFCWADLWGLEVLGLDWERREEAFCDGGLTVIREEDLSEGVFLALRHPHGLPARLRSLAGEETAAMVETLAHNIETCRLHLAAGLCDYRMKQLCK